MLCGVGAATCHKWEAAQYCSALQRYAFSASMGYRGGGNMGVGVAGTWALGVLGVLDVLEEIPFSYCQLPKTNDL